MFCCLGLDSPVPGILFPLPTHPLQVREKGSLCSYFAWLLQSLSVCLRNLCAISTVLCMQGALRAEGQELWVSMAMSLRAICWGGAGAEGKGRTSLRVMERGKDRYSHTGHGAKEISD